MFWICQITTCPVILRSRVAIFYTSKKFYTPDSPRNCFGVVVRGDPWKGVLSARKRGWLGLFRRVLWKKVVKCCWYCLYFTSLCTITMVKDYINGYIVSIWVIFDSFLMYILSLNCKMMWCWVLLSPFCVFFSTFKFFIETLLEGYALCLRFYEMESLSFKLGGWIDAMITLSLRIYLIPLEVDRVISMLV